MHKSSVTHEESTRAEKVFLVFELCITHDALHQIVT